MLLTQIKREFFLAVIDEDNRIFTIEGPMTDDTRWNDAVCRAQSAGRSVRCFTAESDPKQSIADLERRGLKVAKPGSILLPIS